jgi:para-nitrobenzyl esterase
VIKKLFPFLLILSSCAYLVETPPAGLNADLTVKTSSGNVTGARSDINNGAVDWSDIPFAQPPVGDLRWRAPRAISEPNRVITATDNNSCVQEASEYAGVSGIGIVGNEDCLYLDITAPYEYANTKYPVMFWIHGGANTSGTKDYYDFSNFAAEKNIVVVTVNYRLGALGWFSHPAIQETQTGLDQSSNFGTLDLIAALKWVQQNIHKFGGDSKNVTIFGESAGGHNVFALLASPLSEGLFHKAISQSGYVATSSYESAYNVDGQDKLVERGSWQILQDVLPQADNLEQQKNILKNIDASSFMELYLRDNAIDRIPLTTRDGIVIPKIGILAALGDQKYAKRIPVISGTTKDEYSLWLGLNKYFTDAKKPFFGLLPPVFSLKNPDLYDVWVRTRSHAWKIRGSDEPLNALEEAGYEDLFSYQFDWDHQEKSWFADFPRIFGATHGIEIAFLTQDYSFGPISEYIYPKGEARDEMESVMMSAWSDFAKHGDPSLNLPIAWPAYNSENRSFVRLDKNDLLRSDTETHDLRSMLEEMMTSEIPSDVEKCLIALESFLNIGDSDIPALATLNNGSCNEIEVFYDIESIKRYYLSRFGSIETD